VTLFLVGPGRSPSDRRSHSDLPTMPFPVECPASSLPNGQPSVARSLPESLSDRPGERLSSPRKRRTVTGGPARAENTIAQFASRILLPPSLYRFIASTILSSVGGRETLLRARSCEWKMGSSIMKKPIVRTSKKNRDRTDACDRLADAAISQETKGIMRYLAMRWRTLVEKSGPRTKQINSELRATVPLAERIVS
jgi:hypothetical protein